MDSAQLIIKNCNEAIANLEKVIACANNFPDSIEELQVSLLKAQDLVKIVTDFVLLDYDDSDEEECF